MRELGIELPIPPQPFGTYKEVVQPGSLLFLSGKLPTEGSEARYIGRMGAELDINAGRKAAQLAALNGLAVANSCFRFQNWRSVPHFSQEQAAARCTRRRRVHESPCMSLSSLGDSMIAAKTSLDVVRNVKRMYANDDDHVHVLAGSIRHLDHLLAALALDVELLPRWERSSKTRKRRDSRYPSRASTTGEWIARAGRNLEPIPYKALDLSSP